MRSSASPIILVVATVHPILDNLSWTQLSLQTMAIRNQDERKVEGRIKKDIRSIALSFLPYCFLIFFPVIS